MSRSIVVEIAIPPTVLSVRARCHEYEMTTICKDGTCAAFRVLSEGFDCPVGHARTEKPTVFTVAAGDRLPADRCVSKPCRSTAGGTAARAFRCRDRLQGRI